MQSPPSTSVEPTPSELAAKRRSIVSELLARGLGSSQRALVAALAEQGIAVTQATLSRDLKSLGAVKGADGYSLPGAGDADPLTRALGIWLSSAVAAQNLVVLRTPPGGASPLAVEVDASGRAEIVGTVAGDDTILVITPSNADARTLATEFGREAGAR